MAKVRQTNTTRFLEAPFVRMLRMRSASLIKSFECPIVQASNPLFYFQSIKIILGPVYYIEDCRISNFQMSIFFKNQQFKATAFLGDSFSKHQPKEVQIVYRLFLVNCYLLHVSRLTSQPASKVGG